MPETMRCLRCSGELQAGFFYVHNSEHPAFFNYTVWVKGDGQKISEFMGRANAPQYHLVPYRCDQCGMIEMHTGEPERWRH